MVSAQFRLHVNWYLEAPKLSPYDTHKLRQMAFRERLSDFSLVSLFELVQIEGSYVQNWGPWIAKYQTITL